ncbi:MAG TPA: hypothetical protein VGB07_01520 [Blastocatellia bacterium]
MPINPIDTVKLNGLNDTVKTLMRVGINPKEIPSVMAKEILQFETATGHKLSFDYNSVSKEGVFQIIQPTKNNYIKVYKPNQVRLLSSKIDGVTMSANLHKAGFYNHDNGKIAKALRRLADQIESSPVRLADHDDYVLL